VTKNGQIQDGPSITVHGNLQQRHVLLIQHGSSRKDARRGREVEEVACGSIDWSRA
jgi:hypothetical protein